MQIKSQIASEEFHTPQVFVGGRERDIGRDIGREGGKMMEWDIGRERNGRVREVGKQGGREDGKTREEKKDGGREREGGKDGHKWEGILFGSVYACIIDMVFSNGCRAPPWRQVLGDICYIEVNTCEANQLFITASTEGYYVNKASLEFVLYRMYLFACGHQI